MWCPLNNNIIPLIDMSKDKWILPASEDLADYTFEFGHLPNDWFKETVKKDIKGKYNNW